MDGERALAEKLAAILPWLNEKQRRVLLAAEARAWGYGGVSRVARAAGVSRPTIQQGLRDLAHPDPHPDRVRQVGGGRKRLQEQDPTLVADLEALVDPDTRGDPMSPLRWTCKSTRQLATALNQAGHRVGARTVAALLHAARYSLQANAKVLEGTQHPDRNAQFQYLNQQVKQLLADGQPVVSMDAKTKELVGDFKNGGRAWQPQGWPERVHVHDFPDPHLGKAIPDGIYDVGRNAGWVTVGQDHDTASFAVATLRRWWQAVGVQTYPHADRLLICVDGGGSNGSRLRLWKVERQRFATDTSLQVTVCHLPPGTSKWNKIEHCLFAHISMNWRGRPLVSYEVVLQLIGATTTRSGLRVQAELDSARYPTKIKVPDAELARLQITPHSFHGNWNYPLASSPATHAHL